MISYIGDDEEKEDIVSCSAMIASTVQGTMPFMRDMGILLDKSGNVPDQEAYLESNLIDQIEEWEERALVKEIHMEHDDNGKLIPKVVLERNAESD